jgi:transposase-like protein
MNDTMTVKDQAIDFFVNQGKNKSEIARIMDVPRTTIRRWLLEVTDETQVSDKDDMPLSETAIPKRHSCSKDEALDDLRKVANQNPEKCIS